MEKTSRIDHRKGYSTGILRLALTPLSLGFVRDDNSRTVSHFFVLGVLSDLFSSRKTSVSNHSKL
jgi:hypothetical protein